MRPYRGLTKDGKWVYGWPLKLLDGSIIIVGEAARTKIGHPHYPSVSLGKYNFVIPETVGQFTGLKDKNGTEIYEGDIVQSENYEGDGYNKWLVRWNNLTYECVELPWDKENEPPNTYDLSEFAGRLEIIGNIHQNPDLLENKQ